MATSLLLLPLIAGAQQFIAHKGVVRDSYDFWVYTPAGYSDSTLTDLPTVVFLHGRSLCGNDLRKVLNYGPLDAVNKGFELNAIVIAPQNPGGPWKPDELLKVLDWCLEEYPSDTNRVYCIGMSLGGYGTADFAGTYPDRIAAAMALCGGTTLKDLTGLAKVPLWVMHGTADTAVPIKASKELVAEIDRTGNGHVLYNWLQGYSHSSLCRCFYWHKTYDWLFQHSLADEGRPVKLEHYGVTDEDFSVNNSYGNLKSPKENPIPIVEYKK